MKYKVIYIIILLAFLSSISQAGMALDNTPGSDGKDGKKEASSEKSSLGFIPVTAVSTDVTCFGDSNGTGTVTFVGGTPPYTIQWKDNGLTDIPGETDSTITGLTTGFYYVYVWDDNGDFGQDNIFVADGPNISLLTFPEDVQCNGANDGEIFISAASGDPLRTLQYSIDSGNTYSGSFIFGGLAPDDYNIVVKDNLGCTKYDVGNSYTISEPIGLTITLFDSSNLSCFESADGFIETTITGGTTPYVITWDGPDPDPPSNDDIYSLAAGNYDLSVEDDNNCVSTIPTVTLTQPLPIVITTVDVQDATCDGYFDGSISVTVSGGTGPYVLDWDGPNGFDSGVEDIFGLEAGNYTLFVTDANTCPESKVITVNDPDPLVLTIDSIINISCNGLTDGAIYVTTTGGTPGFTYAWTGAVSDPTDEDQTGLAMGPYETIVTDIQGCKDTMDTQVIMEPAAIVITDGPINHVSCFGGSDGDIDVNVVGGTAPYSYSWIGPVPFTASTKPISGLSVGTYTLTVTDDRGCQEVHVVNLTEPSLLVITVDSVNDVTCNGLDDGDIYTTITGGTPGYNLTWTGPGSPFVTADIENLQPGTYKLDITDAKACPATTGDIVVGEPTPLVITLDSTIHISCNGLTDGAIYVTTNGGNPGYTYAWTGGVAVPTAEDQTGLSQGNYKTIVTDTKGCKDSIPLTTINEPNPIVITNGPIVMVSCNGGNDGSIVVNVSDGTPPYKFNWSGPSSFSSTDQNISALYAGTYPLVVTDDRGCIEVHNVDITEPQVLVITVDSVNDVTCNGLDDGDIYTTITGGTPGYNLTWTGPGSPFVTADIEDLQPGTYKLDITDAKACPATTGDIVVGEPTPLVITLDSTIHISCNGLTDGAIYVTTNGGNPGYTYAWTGGVAVPTAEDQTGLSQGNYKTIVTDTKGCKDSIPLTTINEPNPIVITNGPIVMVSCNGGNDGSIVVNVSDGTPPYKFNWSGPSSFSSTDQNISALYAGTYPLVVTDDRGCIEVHNVDITEPQVLVITVDSVNDVTCNGLDDGDIYTTITGGTLGYNLTWTGPGSPFVTADIEDLQPGTYKLDITDAKACPATTGDILVDEPDLLVATLVDTLHVNCNGADDGIINISVTGGTTPYSFNWTGPGIITPTNEDQTNLSPGDYDVVITDANGCIDNLGTYNIKEPTVLNINQDSVHYITCSGVSDGAVFVTPSGGTLPYTFAWTGPGLFTSSAEDITGLAAGDYTLILTDANGCEETLGPVTVSQPGLLTAIIDSVKDVTCFGADNGAVYITANGGTLPYAYEWSDSSAYSSTNEDITGLEPANYYVLVTDSNGCYVELGPMGISEPTELTVVTDDTTNVSCFGADDGSISITVSGGTLPYSYHWTGTGGYDTTIQDISNLPPGAYECSITDANGCNVFVNTIPVTGPSEIVITNDSIRDISCFGGNDGYIYVDVTGGTPGYTYSWSSPGGFTSTDQDVISLFADIYRLTVTDSEGCASNYGPDTLTQPPAIVVVVDSTKDITCKSDSNGEIHVTISGGVMPYILNWIGPGVYTSSSEDITSLPPGDYDLTVTDANSCIYNLPTVTITEPDSLLVSLDSLNDISCFGAGDGAIYVAVTGGTLPYLFAWDGPGIYTSGQEDIDSLEKGDYDLVISDINGCSITLPTVTIIEPDSIWATVVDSVSVLELNCFGDSVGNIEITVSGGTSPFTFNWSGPDSYNSTNEDISGLFAGNYSLTITDAEGCSRDYLPIDSITEPDELQISLVQSDITCFNDNNGTIEAIVTGGVRPYQYSLSGFPADYHQDSVFTGLPPGDVYIYVKDTNSCKTSDTTAINQPAELRITNELRDDTGNQCFGDSNGVIVITAQGGSMPYEYSIDSMDTWQADSTFTGIPAGTYYTFVRDTNGCGDKGSQLDVSQPSEIKIITYLQVDIDSTSCYTSAEGQIFIKASGGVGTINYTLDATETNQSGSFNGVTGGPHLIEMVDNNSCLIDTTIVIDSPPLIQVDSFIVTDVSGCYGDSTGVIDLFASGGTGTLDYAINSGTFQDSSIFANLPANTHVITIRDSNDCTIDTSFLITQPDTISTSSLIINAVTCRGDTNGSIVVVGSGGTAPYTYTLYPDLDSDTIGNFTNLSPGSYGISVDDANGCPTYFSSGLTVLEPDTLIVDSVLSVEMACYGTDDGTISIFAHGGMGQLVFSIDSGASYDSLSYFDSLAGNTYYVAVQDSLGCSVHADTIALPEPPDIIIDTITQIDVVPCAGDSTGSIAITAHGGTGVLNYSIDNNTWQAVDTFANLPAENYTVWVRDEDGCTKVSNTVTIDEPDAIITNITVLHSFNGAPGEINISASGGEGILEYSITGSDGTYSSDTLYTGLWPGDYTVAVRDGLGCIYTEIATIDASPPLEIDVSYSNIDCYGENDGTITLTSVNGTPPVDYSIDDSATFQTDGAYTGLTAGIYIIYVKDGDHRFFKDTVEITEPEPIIITESVTPATCGSIVSDGVISLEVSGGNPGYTYLWSIGDTSRDLNNINAGTYSVTVTDSWGCDTSGSYEVISTVNIMANAGNDTLVCYGDQIILNATGGTTYFWQPEAGLSNPIIANPVVTVTDSMTYILTVTEPGGCYGFDTINIAPHPYLGIDAGQDTTVAVGQTIQLSATGGLFATYSWIPITGFDDPNSQSPFLTVSGEQVYYVTGTTEYGCVESDSLMISTASNLIIYTGFTPNGDGINDFWDIDNVAFYPNITVEVYNRWGRRIFYSEGYSSEERWDGTYDGKVAPIGTYYYIINLNDGSSVIESGPITIVR